MKSSFQNKQKLQFAPTRKGTGGTTLKFLEDLCEKPNDNARGGLFFV